MSRRRGIDSSLTPTICLLSLEHGLHFYLTIIIIQFRFPAYLFVFYSNLVFFFPFLTFFWLNQMFLEFHCN